MSERGVGTVARLFPLEGRGSKVEVEVRVQVQVHPRGGLRM